MSVCRSVPWEVWSGWLKLATGARWLYYFGVLNSPQCAKRKGSKLSCTKWVSSITGVRMVGPTSAGPSEWTISFATEPELGKIERFDKRVDHPNRIILVDPVIEALG